MLGGKFPSVYFFLITQKDTCMSTRNFKPTPIYYAHRDAVTDGFKGTMLDWETRQEKFYKTNKLKNHDSIRKALLAIIQAENL